MFTGLIEEIGTVVGTVPRTTSGAANLRIKINAKVVLEGLKIGDSIATNGVCLTVVAFDSAHFEADVMSQTARHSNLAQLKVGHKVNLERALRLGDRLGGHLVSGHIDDVGKISAIDSEGNAIWYTIKAPDSVLKYVINRGSVAIDGISLTVAVADRNCFKVSIIPHTQGETTLQFKQCGDLLNIECDMFGKYAERLLQFETPASLNMDFLKEHGFLD